MKKHVFFSLTRLFLFLLTYELFYPFIDLTDVNAATQTTMRIYVDFSNPSEAGKLSDIDPQYSASSAKSLDLDLSKYVSGTIVGTPKYTLNGADRTSFTSLAGSILKIQNAPGASTPVFGQSVAKPGHYIYRDPNGKVWAHKGEATKALEFDADSSTFKGNPESQYPGLIPDEARYQETTTKTKYSSELNGGDLRYQFSYSGYSKGIDNFPDYNAIGWAVTTAYEVTPPTAWYENASAIQPNGAGANLTDSDKINTIKIYDATPTDKTPKAIPFSWGMGNSNKGLIRVRELLDDTLKEEDGVYEEAAGDKPYGITRNYFMFANAQWRGTTYKYSSYIDVVTEPSVKPDLVPTSITTSASCIKPNTKVTFDYSFKNNGADIPSGTPVKVEIRADGTVISTKTFSNGVYNGPGYGGSFDYTFGSSGKTFTLVVNADNSISEMSTSNNTLNVPVNTDSSCSPTGSYIGHTSADKESIPWKDNNVVKADWTIPNSCTPVRGKFILTQASGEYFEYGWSTLSSTSIQDFAIFQYGMMGYLQYPGNIHSGRVDIAYKLEDNCGGISTFTQGNFTIGNSPPNRPPDFQIGWFADNDYYSTTPIPDAIVGDRLNVRLLPEVPPNHYDPDDELVTFEWEFAKSSSTWIQSFPSQGWNKGDDKITWLTAPNTVGDHTIYAKMCDQQGACTEKTATINIIRPEPVPCINVPSRVVQNRPLSANAINGACSQPAKNRTIAQEFWTNKLTVYPNVGTETIMLEVKDNYGVMNLPENKAVKQINVVEDKPPVALINLPLIGVRGNVGFKDMSYSPDGDVIVSTQVSYQYDSDNDGNFDEHALIGIPITVGGYTSLPAAKVGKYRVTVKTTEDWGLTDTKQFTINIMNDSPEMTFSVTSANPEPPLFNTTNESEPFMAFGEDWQGSTLNNPNLDKVKNIGFTYNSITKGFTSHYGKNPFNAPATNLVFTPTVVTLGMDQGHSFYVPQLFGSQYLGRKSGVATLGGLTVKMTPSDYLGNSVNPYTGVPYPSSTTINYGLDSYEGTIPSASNPGNFLYMDAKGGTYELACRSYYYSDDDSSYYKYWCDYSRKNADGSPSWTKSFVSSMWDVISYLRLAKTPSEVGVPTRMEINDDGTKIKLPDILFGTACYYGCADTSKWYDVETGQEVPTPAIVRPNMYGATYEDDDVVVIGHSDQSQTSSSWSNSSTTSNYSSTSKGTVTNYVTSYNKHSGVTTRLDLGTCNWDDYERQTGGNGNYLTGVENTGRTYMRDIRFVTSADGYIYVVDGLNKIVVMDKYATKFAEYTTAGTRVYNEHTYAVTYIDKKISIDGAGFGANGEFYMIVHERYFKDRRYNLHWQSCSPCSSGGYIDSYQDDYTGSYEKYYYYTIKGNVTSTPAYAENETGQTMKKNTDITDADYYFDFAQMSPNYSQNTPSGFLFRAKNNNNMYRLEFNSNRLSLSKIVNGVRTELRNTVINLNTTDYTNFKVSVRGSKIKVRMGANPVFDVTDTTFDSGTYGAFIGAYGSHFRNVVVKVPIVDNNKIDDMGIAGEALTYTTDFQDPETDPEIKSKEKWKYEHMDVTKFLDAGDGRSGVSMFNNQTVTGEPVKILDKVGVYKMTLIGTDDPAPTGYAFPDSTFAMYQSDSDPYSRNVLIHRRPIAQISCTQDIYYAVTCDDSQSHDPDRWLNPWTYSTEATGINYATTKGIVDRRYEYTMPDGTTNSGLIGRVKEMGMYTFRVAVKDEYGAWSDWAESFIWLNAAPENHVPHVDLTNPTGTYENPSGAPAANPTLTWNAVDFDADSVITGYELEIQYYYYNYYSNPQWFWVSQSSIITGTTDLKSDGNVVAMSRQVNFPLDSTRTYKIRVRVKDEKGAWSEWSEKYMRSGYPPSAQITFPNGTQSNPTTITDGLLKLSFNQSDPDVPTIYTSYQYRILDEFGNQLKMAYYAGGLEYDAIGSGSYAHGCYWESDGSYWTGCSFQTTANSWTMQSVEYWPLRYLVKQTGPYQVQVKVSDGRYWSDWSNTGWFTNNSPPVATMIEPNGTETNPTVFNSLRPIFRWSQTDPDPATTFSYFQLQITNEANNIMLVDTGQFYQGSISGAGEWTSTQDLPAGQKLRVRVRVFDGSAWSEYSQQTWFMINRPPIVDFSWMPQPVWEGDDVHVINAAVDPDGDALTYAWTVERPDGSVNMYNTEHITDRFSLPGFYRVSLTASDGRLSHTAVKMIEVLPLTIHSDVTYTEQWRMLHEQSGHQTAAVPKQFYSGEVLVLTSRSAPAPVDEVTAWLDTVGLDGHSLFVMTQLQVSPGDSTLFQGELYDSRLQSFTQGLPNGLQTIHFRIRYRNGVVKTEDIPIDIIGNVYESVGVHRVQ
ncbi:CARDB domain-containing protein [Paenibacillus oryzisoli]|uniref:glycoside hydrolase family 78 protein n=1 Tax=Paenibacillus oryzisoli TaxID=1850517 RepID=UPI003D279D32